MLPAVDELDVFVVEVAAAFAVTAVGLVICILFLLSCLNCNAHASTLKRALVPFKPAGSAGVSENVIVVSGCPE